MASLKFALFDSVTLTSDVIKRDGRITTRFLRICTQTANLDIR
jgi:hypothetical protein